MQTTILTLFTLAELPTVKAREKALQWAREALLDEWWESVYNDAEQVGLRIEGFDTGRGDYCNVCFQHDPASVAVAIMREHGGDTEKAAAMFASADDEYNGVNGKITLATPDKADELQEEYDAKIEEFRQVLSRCYLKQLREELEYREGAEYLAEMCEANGYTFTITGERRDAETMAERPKLEVLEEEDGLSVLDAEGNVIAATENSELAEMLATNPLTVPLSVEDINEILCERMGWELVDVAAFFHHAEEYGKLQR